VAHYPTPDGATLLWDVQVPASVNGDGNVDAAEYLLVDTCAVRVDHDAADLNKDCVVDVADLAVFATCMSGPDSGVAPSCPAGVDSDLDSDGDADVGDYAFLQSGEGD
jgi:hypothetical protein